MTRLQERSAQLAQMIVTQPAVPPGDTPHDDLPVGTYWVLDDDGSVIPVPGPAERQSPEEYLRALTALWAEE